MGDAPAAGVVWAAMAERRRPAGNRPHSTPTRTHVRRDPRPPERGTTNTAGKPRPRTGTAGKHRSRTVGTRSIEVAERGREHQDTGREGQVQEDAHGNRGEPRASGENQERNYTNRAARACNRDDVIKLQPQSHLQSHPRSHVPLPNPLIPLTKPYTYDLPTRSGKGSGERRGATHPKTCGFRPGRGSSVTPAGSGRSP